MNLDEASAMHESRLAIGLAGPVLASIGLMLFFLPILSIPLGAIGLLLSLVAIALLARRADVALRWALIGLVVSSLALGTAVAVNFDAIGEEPGRQVPAPWQPVPDRPTVSPPARSMQPTSAHFRLPCLFG
ncbi:MAG TPA: hypothetical protein VHZ24_21875 [Pirellulales bacterium]|jgi:hypothetical protein|nr:hypothetical protein [Pirellulales bacterium]